jgi:signal peptidase I
MIIGNICYLLLILALCIMNFVKLIFKQNLDMESNKGNKQADNQNSMSEDDFDMSHFSDKGESIATSWAKRFGLLVFEVVKVVVISLAIILPIRLWLVQPFYVEGASMEPSFYDSEYLIINEISYRFEEPQRGEVIIFRNPQNTKIYFIKRVLGLPGETIEIKQGKVFIDDELIEESYIENFSTQSKQATILAEDEYFVMGDNRTNSFDSRSIGPIKAKHIIGKVWVRGWPLDRINTFNLPTY